jgi:hypothetical protein
MRLTLGAIVFQLVMMTSDLGKPDASFVVVRPGECGKVRAICGHLWLRGQQPSSSTKARISVNVFAASVSLSNEVSRSQIPEFSKIFKAGDAYQIELTGDGMKEVRVDCFRCSPLQILVRPADVGFDFYLAREESPKGSAIDPFQEE